MDFQAPALSIASSSRDGKILLVCATDAIRMCRGGAFQAIDASRARPFLDHIERRDMGYVREFLTRSRLPRVSLSSLADSAVLELLARSIRMGDLTVLKAGESTHRVDAGTKEQRRLVKGIEAKSRGRLTHSGRHYKLVADVDLTRVPDRDSYEVVPHAAAVEVLEGLAHQPGTAELPALLHEAQQKLTRDWRPPLSPDGLILLRRTQAPPVVAAAPGDPLTPSQMKAMLKKTEWIEIEVIDDKGKAYPGKYRVERPDGTVDKGELGGNGLWADYDIDPGNCKLFLEPAGEASSSQGEAAAAKKPVATRVRLVGMLFDANKCFLLPQALPGIRKIVKAHKADPGAEVLIVGHAGGDEDLAGADIAFDRAQILGAFLKSKPNPWLNWFGPDKPARSRWGMREIQLMLSVLPEGEEPFYRGYASGLTDNKTTAAIKKFQEYNNADKDSWLSTTGNPDFDTRKALVEAYMSLEHTTLGDDVTPIAHGCEGHFEDTATASGVTADDRRLEVFFFAQGIDPRPEATISSAGTPLYGKWLEQVAETRDFECHGIHVQIIDAKKQPAPFATVRLSGPTSAEATSDEHGFVSFFGLKQGVYTIASEKNGYKIGVSKLTYPTAKTVTGCAKTEGA